MDLLVFREDVDEAVNEFSRKFSTRRCTQYTVWSVSKYCEYFCEISMTALVDTGQWTYLGMLGHLGGLARGAAQGQEGVEARRQLLGPGLLRGREGDPAGHRPEEGGVCVGRHRGERCDRGHALRRPAGPGEYVLFSVGWYYH